MNKTLLHREVLTATAVDGTISVNTERIEGMCRQIVVSPDTSSTSYTIKLLDSDNLVIFETDTETGDYCELTDLPVRGVTNVQILNITANEEFQIRLMVEV